MKSLAILNALILVVGCTSLPLKGQNSPTPIANYSPDQGFVIHEWGTFTTLQTSDGRLLNGLEKEEEKVPAFVKNICFCVEQYRTMPQKGFDKKYNILKNVNLKMETPVLYFYHNEPSAKTVSLNVKFQNGSISQWYPTRSNGESNYIPQLMQWPPYVPKIIDFSIPRTGEISWSAEILPAGENLPYTNPVFQETPQWIAPRQTQSNLVRIPKAIEVGYPPVKIDQIEKFLFYRGVGNIAQPLRVEFNTVGNLVITNPFNETVPYVFIYEMGLNGEQRIWWSGKLSAGRIKVIESLKEDAGAKSPKLDLTGFTKALVVAGLYEDEALAMLETWKKSYFDHPGLKVFWILPKSITDQLLPIEFFPNPQTLQRVLVGRSEILTPEFEKELAQLDQAAFNNRYSGDRFELAYRELLSTEMPSKWTDYNTITEDETEVSEQPFELIPQRGFDLYPNPANSELVISVSDYKQGERTIRLTGADGRIVFELNKITIGKNQIDVSQLSPGVYTVWICFSDGESISKKIVKN
jgi:hypothetical protein